MAGTFVLIVAAGRGLRAGGDVPKQYVQLAGKFVLTRCIETFLDHPAINGIAVVIHADDRDLYNAATSTLADRLVPPVTGGATRQLSVLAGLRALQPLAPDAVLIHDAARPFVDAPLIDRVKRALDKDDCVLPVVPMTDTIKRGAAGRVIETVDRRQLFSAQTPQGFRFSTILGLHEKAAVASGVAFTDDASIAEWAGLTVLAVDGAVENRKLTTMADMRMAELQLRAEDVTVYETRTGFGYDVHRFEPGDAVILCGVAIPFSQKLEGHSDADVGMHALTDSILGAISSADIGFHFPPSDPRWKGAPSHLFLAHAAKLVTERGGKINHVDVTIICERPKVGPHRDAMRTELARILGISIDRVSVKATTTEGLGFTGRGEGIAANAVATVTIPSARTEDGIGYTTPG